MNTHAVGENSDNSGSQTQWAFLREFHRKAEEQISRLLRYLSN